MLPLLEGGIATHLRDLFFRACFYRHLFGLFIDKKDYHILISISLVVELNFHKCIGLFCSFMICLICPPFN